MKKDNFHKWKYINEKLNFSDNISNQNKFILIKMLEKNSNERISLNELIKNWNKWKLIK